MSRLNSTIQGGLNVNGSLSVAGAVSMPNANLPGSAISPTAGLSGDQLVPLVKVPAQIEPPGSSIVASTTYLFTAGGAGTLDQFFAAITGAIATGSDRTVSVDLQKSTGGGAPATVLSAPIQFTHTSTLLTASAATLATPNYVAGDSFFVVVTVAGTASAQALGLGATLQTAELFS